MKSVIYKRLTLILCIIIFCAISFLTGCSKSDDNKTKLPDGFTKMTDKDIADAIPDYTEYVTLGDYSNLTYHLYNDYTVTDEDIKNGLINALPNITTKTEITDRAAQAGDTVNISYKGTIDGKTFNGSQTGQNGDTIILGSANYIDGFEDNIIGMNIGETKTIDITYPNDYGNDAVNGKTAQFEITLNSIQVYDLPELTDELIKANSKYQTVDEIKAACKTALEKEYADNRKLEIYNNIISNIMNKSSYNGYPQAEIDSMIATANEAIESYASLYNISKAEVMEKAYGVTTSEEFDSIILEETKEYLKIKMTICALAKDNNITVTAKEFDEYRINIMNNFNVNSVDDLLKYYTEEDLLFNCLLEKVQTWMIDNATEV